MDYFATRAKIQAEITRTRNQAKPTVKGEVIGNDGFLTEVAGRVILTAPASTITMASELPVELAERWERASTGNPYMSWLQGRFVEAEKANRNGAFWSTEDLKFGEMSVKHGPLNWLHEETTIVGTIADNALIHPPALQLANLNGYSTTTSSVTFNNVTNVTGPQPRPYIAAVSAVWKWVHPAKAQEIEKASDDGKLYYSMECIAREMACTSDETHQGCGQSFDYIKAMTDPQHTCEHIAARSSARRMVDPSFLGGAVIVPPVQPGWGNANVQVMKQQASLLAEQTHAAAGDMTDGQWESLMAAVVRFATQ